MHLTAFFAYTLVLFIFISILWSKADWPNILIKIMFLAATIWCAVELMINLGWIVKG